MSDEPRPDLLGPSKGDCEGRQEVCTLAAEGACPRYGKLRKADRDGARRVDGCGDPVAGGRANKRTGTRGQTKGRKALRVPGTSSMSPGHEEHYGGTLRMEHKEGGQAGPVFTRFLAAQAQSEQHRPVGDARPFVATFGKGKKVLIVLDADDQVNVALAILEQHGYTITAG